MDSGIGVTIFAKIETQRSQTLHTIYVGNLHFLYLDPSSVELLFFFLDCGPKEFNLLIFVIGLTPRQFNGCTSFHTEHSKIYQTKFFPVKNMTEVHFNCFIL